MDDRAAMADSDANDPSLPFDDQFCRTARQRSRVRPLIGVLSPLSATAATRNAAFRSALRDLGYVELARSRIRRRTHHDAGAAVWRRLKPDVLVTGAQSGAMVVYEATV